MVPSRHDKKAPLCPYRCYYDDGEFPPEELFAQFPESRNAQALMGQPFGFFAIDLDGDEARDVWDGWVREHGRPFRTWVTHSGGGGRHLWFRIPEWWGQRPLPYATLWRGAAKHSAIERLGDYKLVMLPGSTHPESGNPYRFEAGHSPLEIPTPCAAPAWVMRLKGVDAPKAKRAPQGWLQNLPEKVARCQAWGVRFTGRVRNGWHECHAIERDDTHPSAAVHEDSGYYVDLGSGERLSFIQLAVRVGPFLTDEDALDAFRQEVCS